MKKYNEGGQVPRPYLTELLQQVADTHNQRAITRGGLTKTHRITNLVRTPRLVNDLKYFDPDDNSMKLNLNLSATDKN